MTAERVNEVERGQCLCLKLKEAGRKWLRVKVKGEVKGEHLFLRYRNSLSLLR